MLPSFIVPGISSQSNFYLPGPFTFIFSQILSQLFNCVVADTVFHVGVQNKIVTLLSHRWFRSQMIYACSHGESLQNMNMYQGMKWKFVFH